MDDNLKLTPISKTSLSPCHQHLWLLWGSSWYYE